MDQYPWDLLLAGQLRWRPVDGYITTESVVFGEDQRRNPRPGWRWQAELSNINLGNPQRARTWEAMLLNWRLGAELTLVPRYGGVLTPLLDIRQPRFHVPHSDGTPFSDGSRYQQPAIEASLAQAVALGATTATINIAGGRALLGSEPFGLDGPIYSKRVYGAARIVSAPANGAADGTYTVRFGPPAREAYPAGAAVNFVKPSCVMRPNMTNGDKMWPTFERPFKAMVSVVFIETFKMTDSGDV